MRTSLLAILILACLIGSPALAAEMTGTTAAGDSVKVNFDPWTLITQLIPIDKLFIFGGVGWMLWQQYRQGKVSPTPSPITGEEVGKIDIEKLKGLIPDSLEPIIQKLIQGMGGNKNGLINIPPVPNIESFVRLLTGIPKKVNIDATIEMAEGDPIVLHFSRGIKNAA